MIATLKKWEPNENQTRALTLMLESGCSLSLHEISKAISISPTAVYQWFDTPAFSMWWEAAIEGYFHKRLSRRYAKLDEAAEGFPGKADIGAIRLFLQRFDRQYAPRSRQEQQRTGEVRVTVRHVHVPPPYLAQTPDIGETPALEKIPENSSSQDAPQTTIMGADDPQATPETPDRGQP